MLPKKFRITIPQFRNNPSAIRRYQGEWVRVLVKNGKTVPRIVILIPARLDKRSAKRHFMKRTIIEALRPLLHTLPADLQILVKVTRVFTKTEKLQVRQELEKLFTLSFGKSVHGAKRTS